MKSYDGMTASTGNVFADLGLENPEEQLLKSQLTMQIQLLIDKKGLTQKRVADLIGLDQPKVSKLLRGRFLDFSVERLLNIINRLGRNIEVRISEEEYAPEDTHLLVRMA